MAPGKRVTCAIVADDLTGAADACAPFVERGLSGVVGIGALPVSPEADVVAISTESRGLSPSAAADRVRRLGERCASACDEAVRFKKIDSTLRGHVGQELAVVMEAWSATRAIVAPAFPSMGRTLEAGVLRVAWAHAAEADAPSCHLPSRLASQGFADCRLVTRPTGNASPDAWARALAAALGSPCRAIVCDTEQDSDLDAIVHATWSIPERIVWVGSAGLAGALARQLATRRAESRPPAVSGPGAIVLCVGSQQSVTIEQRARLLRDGGARLAALQVPDPDALRRHLEAGRHVVLNASPALPDEALAQCVRLAVSCRVRGFVMSGGDTAARVCRMLRVDAIEIGGEVASGMPWGWLHASTQTTTAPPAEPLRYPARQWPVVLKAGGFGGPDAFVQALTFLTEAA